MAVLEASNPKFNRIKDIYCNEARYIDEYHYGAGAHIVKYVHACLATTPDKRELIYTHRDMDRAFLDFRVYKTSTIENSPSDDKQTKLI